MGGQSSELDIPARKIHATYSATKPQFFKKLENGSRKTRAIISDACHKSYVEINCFRVAHMVQKGTKNRKKLNAAVDRKRKYTKKMLKKNLPMLLRRPTSGRATRNLSCPQTDTHPKWRYCRAHPQLHNLAKHLVPCCT